MPHKLFCPKQELGTHLIMQGLSIYFGAEGLSLMDNYIGSAQFLGLAGLNLIVNIVHCPMGLNPVGGKYGLVVLGCA